MPADESSKKRSRNGGPIQVPGGFSTAHYSRLRFEERHQAIRGELHDPSNQRQLSAATKAGLRAAWLKRGEALAKAGATSGAEREEHARFAAGHGHEVNEIYRLAMSGQHRIVASQQQVRLPDRTTVRPDLTLASPTPTPHFAEVKSGKEIEGRSERQLSKMLQRGDVTLFTGASSADVDVEALKRIDAANTGPNRFLVGTSSMHEGMGVTVSELMERIRLRGKHPELFERYPTDTPRRKG